MQEWCERRPHEVSRMVLEGVWDFYQVSEGWRWWKVHRIGGLTYRTWNRAKFQTSLHSKTEWSCWADESHPGWIFTGYDESYHNDLGIMGWGWSPCSGPTKSSSRTERWKMDPEWETDRWEASHRLLEVLGSISWVQIPIQKRKTLIAKSIVGALIECYEKVLYIIWFPNDQHPVMDKHVKIYENAFHPPEWYKMSTSLQ